MPKIPKSSTKQSKIVRYKLEKETIALRRAGKSYQEIADVLNATGKVPEFDKIDKFVVSRFLEKIPKVAKEIVKNNEERMIEAVYINFDIIQETNALYQRSKTLLDELDNKARNEGKIVNPYQFKAVVSEMREMLKQMTEIQKEINDYNNVRRFMEIVLETLYDEVPDKIPAIIERLKLNQGTTWFANIMSNQATEDREDYYNE